MNVSCDDDDFKQKPNCYSITSIGLLNPLEEINVSKDSFQLRKRSSCKKLPKTPMQNEDLVTSIEYRINENEEVNESQSSLNLALNRKESADLDFLNKVQFDREKYFRIHFQIEKPEKELIEETLLHFEKKTDTEKEAISQRKTSKVRKTLQTNKRIMFPRNLSQETQSNGRLSLSRSMLPKKNNTNLSNKAVEFNQKCCQPKVTQINKDIKNNSNLNTSHNIPFVDLKPSFSDKSSLKSITGPLKVKKRKDSSVIFTEDFPVKSGKSKESFVKMGLIHQTETNNPVIQKKGISDQSEGNSTEKCKCVEILEKLKVFDISLTENILEQVMQKLNTINYSFEEIQGKYKSLKSENEKLKQQIHKLEKKKPENDLRVFLTKRSSGLSFLNEFEKNAAAKKSNPCFVPQSTKHATKPPKIVNFANVNNTTLNIPGTFLKNRPFNDVESINTQRDSTTRKTTSFLSKRKSFFDKKRGVEKDAKIVFNIQNNAVLKPTVRNLHSKPSPEKCFMHFRG